MTHSDAELLRQYVDNRSEAAFTTLVHRHLDLVYSSALRQLGGDEELARDVAQNVFLDFARKAKSFRSRNSLAGWLYTSARFAATNVRRSVSAAE